jgi:hypothetical protein
MEECQDVALPLFFGGSGILLNVLLMFFPPTDAAVSTMVNKAASDLITGAIALTIPIRGKNRNKSD